MSGLARNQLHVKKLHHVNQKQKTEDDQWSYVYFFQCFQCVLLMNTFIHCIVLKMVPVFPHLLSPVFTSLFYISNVKTRIINPSPIRNKNTKII